ncbi:MAG: hypothetical protein NT154_33400 [Verrucomicrobia bacterium]|nr:hypothetical protein [Verrucomicrobiota bacterium]
MKKTDRRVPTQFGPETGFEVSMAPPAPFRARQEAEFERLKAQLLAERLDGRRGPRVEDPVRQAASEAAALAWATQYPLLVYLALFDERAGVALLRAKRQEQVRQRSRVLMAA